MDWHLRTRLLFGDEALKRIQKSKIFLAGLGGVGGACFEALMRAGIRSFELCDPDVFEITNLNRQLLALPETLGEAKVNVAEEKLRRFGEGSAVLHPLRLTPENIPSILQSAKPSFVVDCIDDLRAKRALLETAVRLGYPVISAGGAGNRIEPTGIQIKFLEQVTYDPLAKRLRRELRHLPYKTIHYCFQEKEVARKAAGPVGSSPYLPSIMGLTMAGFVLQCLAE